MTIKCQKEIEKSIKIITTFMILTAQHTYTNTHIKIHEFKNSIKKSQYAFERKTSRAININFPTQASFSQGISRLCWYQSQIKYYLPLT